MGDEAGALDLAGPLPITYMTMGIPALIERITGTIEPRVANVDSYRKHYADKYFTSGPVAEQYWQHVDGFAFSDDDDDTEESELSDDEETREENRRKRKRRRREDREEDVRAGRQPRLSMVHRSGRLNYVPVSDDFCFMCHTNPNTIVDIQNQPVHAQITNIVNTRLREGVSFEWLVPDIFILFNYVMRPMMRDITVATRGGKAKIMSCFHTGIVPVPRWTIPSIVNHYIYHKRHPAIVDCVMQTELSRLNTAVISRIVPSNTADPVNIAAFQTYKEIVKLQLQVNASVRKTTTAALT